jgi:hypothetical protein
MTATNTNSTRYVLVFVYGHVLPVIPVTNVHAVGPLDEEQKNLIQFQVSHPSFDLSKAMEKAGSIYNGMTAVIPVHILEGAFDTVKEQMLTEFVTSDAGFVVDDTFPRFIAGCPRKTQLLCLKKEGFQWTLVDAYDGASNSVRTRLLTRSRNFARSLEEKAEALKNKSIIT